jgi:hypothetical protein
MGFWRKSTTGTDDDQKVSLSPSFPLSRDHLAVKQDARVNKEGVKKRCLENPSYSIHFKLGLTYVAHYWSRAQPLFAFLTSSAAIGSNAGCSLDEA